ncbi:histone-lysine N-methyltransferase SETDB2-like [Numida meleagris]|uniref:histone-lysine N-methyltransferase SETDB2-like n=1 Tax=Numida meleagris TaxID=8996 RepID=UPI000B3DDEDE|nr:histone-lysine N-methyltransferase SETDB2-like [Numida meleagris]
MESVGHLTAVSHFNDVLRDRPEEENRTTSRKVIAEGDLKAFWTRLESRRVDIIFEQVQEVLLLLKEKIKNGTATNQEYLQAWALVNEADLGDLLTLTNVNDVLDGENIQETKPKLQDLVTDDNTGNSVEGSRSKKKTEKSDSESEEASSEIRHVPLNPRYRKHKCSSACLSNRAVSSYKGENPLKIPILFHFQRRHAKADCLSKSLDVSYKAPCGRSLRSFQDVQSYLFETKCDFLFIDHFSFNTYVLLGRNTVNPEPLVFDFDISNGAESVPISFCNDIDRARLPYFKYRRTSWPRGYYLNNLSSMFLDSCDCTDGCIDRSKCACLQLTARGCSKVSVSPNTKTARGYSYKRLEGPVPSGIYECSVSCRCDKMMCQNRVVQHGIQVRLQVFNTEKKGWGVRCLDDIDKGTFVCTYSGRLKSRAEVQELGDAEQNLKEESAVNDEGHSFSSKKRKLDAGCSDSEIELVQTGKDDILEKQKSSSEAVDNGSTLIHPKNLNTAAVRRLGTRIAVVDNHQLKMEVNTLVHSASSDEDNCSQPHQSSKTELTSGTKKERSIQKQKEDLVEAGQTNPAEMDSAECKRKNLSLRGVACGRSGVLNDKYVVKPSTKAPQKVNCKEEDRRQSKQGILCMEADSDRTLLKNANDENIYILDATKEGNVGRFLNHSCCPNLFAQSVFVETHNRSFPWVAFFTNRHVKAGTELTWDYGYEAGSMPETEISCWCGVQKCRKKRGDGPRAAPSPISNPRPRAGQQPIGSAKPHPVAPNPTAGFRGALLSMLRAPAAPAYFRAPPPPRGSALRCGPGLEVDVDRCERSTVSAASAGWSAPFFWSCCLGRHGSAWTDDVREWLGASSAARPSVLEAALSAFLLVEMVGEPPAPRDDLVTLGSAAAKVKVTCQKLQKEFATIDNGSPSLSYLAYKMQKGILGRKRNQICVEARHLEYPTSWEWEIEDFCRGLAQKPQTNLPVLGAFWRMAKMVRRTCAFCSEGEAGSIMYIAKEQNIAAHQDCLLFSSGFVESEEYNPENLDLRFDVESVLNELKRGKRLVCNFCRKKGATVGCEERACRRSYHYFCALCDDAAIETDEVNGVYRVFCSKHDPGNRTNRYGAANKRKRHVSKSSTVMEQMGTEETAEENRLRILRRKSSRHKVRIDFLRKCKQAGLLDDIFEEMLDTLHLAQEKLMDDNTSETEYEETVISLFDCGLFENILTNIHSGTEEKIQELLESRRRLDNQLELLRELKEVSLPSQESGASTSSTVSE